MARTLETRDAIVEGGPNDGLRMRVKIKDNGEAEVVEGAIFLGGPIGRSKRRLEQLGSPYWFDSERNVIVYEG